MQGLRIRHVASALLVLAAAALPFTAAARPGATTVGTLAPTGNATGADLPATGAAKLATDGLDPHSRSLKAGKCDKCNLAVAQGGCKCNNNCDCISGGNKCDKCNLAVAQGGCKCNSNCDCISGGGGTCSSGYAWQTDRFGVTGCVNTWYTCPQGGAWSVRDAKCNCLPSTPNWNAAANICTAGTGGGGSGGCNGASTGAPAVSMGRFTGNDYVALHNAYRAWHHACALTRDSGLEAQAQNWANRLAGSCAFQHSGQGPENLYQKGSSSSVGDFGNWGTALWAWYAEINLYNYNIPGFNALTGHATQVLWKSAKKVGCAYANSGRCGQFYNRVHVCRYDTGNVQGQFGSNVQRP